MAEYTNYAVTQYKQREQQDDGMMGAGSPPVDQSGSSSFLGNFQRSAIVGAGVYVGAQIVSGVTSNIKDLTGSTALQLRVNNFQKIGASLLGGLATSGVSLGLQGVQEGINYVIRVKTTQIENQAKREERDLLGAILTNGTGSAYYD